jgi:hypothetical protein
MTYTDNLKKFTITLVMLLAAAPLTVQTASADLLEWLDQVNNYGTTPTFVGTGYAALPVSVDIGTLSGDRTYEFIVSGESLNGDSSVLMGNGDGSGGWAIKYEQWQNEGAHGITHSGVADYLFTPSATTYFELETHLAFVVANGVTTLYVNSVDVATAVELGPLTGLVGLGGWLKDDLTTFADEMTGTIIGVATYDYALTQQEICDQEVAYFGVPEPATLSLVGVALLGLLTKRRR